MGVNLSSYDNLDNFLYLNKYSNDNHSIFIKNSKSLFSSFFEFFNIHLEKIINLIKFIKANIDKVIDDFHIKDNADKINEELFDISLNLNKINYFKNEFIAFLGIKDMISYIIDNDKLDNINCLKFAEELLEQFLELLNIKSDNENNLTEYPKIYDKFNKFLNSQEEYFYTEIYIPSHKYDDAIVKITNTLR